MLSFEQEITSAGGIFTFDPTSWGGNSAAINLTSSSNVVLANDCEIVISNLPNTGEVLEIFNSVGANVIDLNGHTFKINGQTIPQWVWNNEFVFLIQNFKNSAIQQLYADIFLGANNNGLDGSVILLDGSTTLDKLEDLASGKIIVGNVSNRPTAVTPTGDVTISNAGVTAIGASKITNSMISGIANIARSKLADGSFNHVLINSNVGVMTSEAQLAASRGGNGDDFSASTGFQTWNAGTASVGAISELITLQVSFESGYAGDFKIQMPYAGTVTEIYAYATKVIAGTDNGTIVPKDNGGTTMTDGTITFTASDPRGTAYTSTPSANNTFVAGDLLTFTTAKTTAGGVVQLSITVTRTS
jgi:hypothetical protein